MQNQKLLLKGIWQKLQPVVSTREVNKNIWQKLTLKIKPENLRPKLKENIIEIKEVITSKDKYWVLYNQQNHHYEILSPEEMTAVKFMDGNHSLGEIASLVTEQTGVLSTFIFPLYENLRHQGFLSSMEKDLWENLNKQLKSSTLAGKAEKIAAQAWHYRLPMDIFSRLLNKLGKNLAKIMPPSKLTYTILLLLALLGAGIFVYTFNTYELPIFNLMGSHTWGLIFIYLTILFTSLVMALAQAIYLQFRNCSVRSSGLDFYLGLPLFYVDNKDLCFAGRYTFQGVLWNITVLLFIIGLPSIFFLPGSFSLINQIFALFCFWSYVAIIIFASPIFLSSFYQGLEEYFEQSRLRQKIFHFLGGPLRKVLFSSAPLSLDEKKLAGLSIYALLWALMAGKLSTYLLRVKIILIYRDFLQENDFFSRSILSLLLIGFGGACFLLITALLVIILARIWKYIRNLSLWNNYQTLAYIIFISSILLSTVLFSVSSLSFILPFLILSMLCLLLKLARAFKGSKLVFIWQSLAVLFILALFRLLFSYPKIIGIRSLLLIILPLANALGAILLLFLYKLKPQIPQCVPAQYNTNLERLNTAALYYINSLTLSCRGWTTNKGRKTIKQSLQKKLDQENWFIKITDDLSFSFTTTDILANIDIIKLGNIWESIIIYLENTWQKEVGFLWLNRTRKAIYENMFWMDRELLNEYVFHSQKWVETDKSLVFSDAKLEETIKKLPLFSNITPEELQTLKTAWKIKTVNPGETIVKQGEPGNEFFVILNGVMEVIKTNELGESEVLAHLHSGDYFGEIALLEEIPRTATVKCIAYGALLVLSRENFQIVIGNKLKAAKSIDTYFERYQLLRTVPLFADFTPEQLSLLSSRFEERHFNPQEQLITQGEMSNEFFLIAEGKVEVWQDKQSQKITLAVLSKGEFIGEQAILFEQPRSANVTALTPVTTLVLSKSNFADLIENNLHLQRSLALTASRRIYATKKTYKEN